MLFVSTQDTSMKKKKYRLGRSRSGLGLFATKPFEKGEFVIEYTGEKLSAEEAEKKGGLYLFEVDENLTLDGTDRRHTARYLN
ncbi:MAG TPA: SET domain-containing protein, partial [Candidatus Moranbacteria bacterium]|nr:SET domain-containing protein [Candidatus Moranbacteria bacterium]